MKRQPFFQCAAVHRVHISSQWLEPRSLFYRVDSTHTHTHTIKTRYTPEQVKKLLLRNLGAGGAAAPNAHHIVRRHIQHTNLYINVSSTEHTTLYTQYRTSAGDGADVKNLYYYHVPLP